MLSYFFSPLDTHFDKGFGAIGDSFHEAASSLKDEYASHKINGHLPICYLYRHAIELYLKASILIIHRRLKISYDGKSDSDYAYLFIGTERKSFYSEHRISPLYEYLVHLFEKNKDYLAANTRLNWSFPDNFDTQIKRIQALDSSSTYFRYPGKESAVYEKEKSAFKETTVDEVMALALKEKKPMKTMAKTQMIGQPAQVFIHDDSFTEEAVTLLAEIADTLSGCHFGLIHELADS